jgi:hypothetical protein
MMTRLPDVSDLEDLWPDHYQGHTEMGASLPPQQFVLGAQASHHSQLKTRLIGYEMIGDIHLQTCTYVCIHTFTNMKVCTHTFRHCHSHGHW